MDKEYHALRLRSLGIQEKLEAEHQLLERRRTVESELQRLAGKIPTWDRVLFIHLTGDEIAEDELKKELKRIDAELAEIDEALRTALSQLGAESVELRLSGLVELCLRQTRHLMAARPVTKNLTAALQAVSDEVRVNFAPDLDWDGVLAGLEQEPVCQQLATEEAATEWPSGYPPIDAAKLRRLAARKLVREGLFGLLGRMGKLSQEVQAAAGHLSEASSRVSRLDLLNILWESPQEVLVRELRQKLEQLQAEGQRLQEEVRRLVFESLAAYPPLGIELCALEALALLRRMTPAHEPSLGADGRQVMAPVWLNRNLVLAALGRLRAAFRRAFPDTPLPRELMLERPVADTPLNRCLKQLETPETLDLRERALDHALMLGALEARLSRARTRVSPVDKLSFWHTSRAEVEVTDLQHSLRWHQAVLGRYTQALREAARRAGQTLLPLRVRDWALALTQSVAAIQTEAGTTSQPRSCNVLGRDQALQSFETLRSLFSQYGLTGSYYDFLQIVAHARPALCEVVPDPMGGFAPIDAGKLAGLLALRVERTDFSDSVRRLAELQGRERELAAAGAEASSQISLWDTLNIFTVTSAERQRDQVNAERSRVGPEIARLHKHVDQLFSQAGAVYPPAVLYFSLESVRWAIRAITATCSVSSTRSGGRTRRRYTCVLNGKPRAVSVLQGWCAQLVTSFGVMPTYASILEAWETRKLL